MKITTILSSLAMLLISTSAAFAEPIVFRGERGEYTIDYEAGTYNGCVKGSGCIFLGRDKKIDVSTWRNGEYVYSINDGVIRVYKRGRVIFEDFLYSERDI